MRVCVCVCVSERAHTHTTTSSSPINLLMDTYAGNCRKMLWTLGWVYLLTSVFCFFPDIYLEGELLGQVVYLFLVSEQLPFCPPQWPRQFTFPPRRTRAPFLHNLASICYVCSSRWQPFWQVWGDVSLWFWFALPWWLGMKSIFPCAYRPSAFPPWKSV